MMQFILQHCLLIQTLVLWTSVCNLSPDYLNTHPLMFRANSPKDPDTSGICKAMPGPHKGEVLEVRVQAIQEFEEYGTWEVVNHASLKHTQEPEGALALTQIIPTTQMVCSIKLKCNFVSEVISKFDLCFSCCLVFHQYAVSYVAT